MITMRVEANWEAPQSASYARAGMHKIILDEPVAMGGEDLGANPMQYLFSALAGCTIGMGRMVAKEMELDIKRITCRVEGDIDRDGLTGANPDIRPGCQEIRMTVSVDSAEPKETIAAWLAIVEKRCPVRDTVANATPIIINLKA